MNSISALMSSVYLNYSKVKVYFENKTRKSPWVVQDEPAGVARPQNHE
jgi:hypothetical protein